MSVFKGGFHMEILTKIKGWAGGLTEVGVSLLSLGIVLEVLFGGTNIPFWPNISVIANVQSIVAGFSAQGLVGLVAVWVLYSIYSKK
jgi:hypothetical protein|tara:strand:+ start:980 stop:1240 length:261 start_codon:yes stop_codon:yes gene_type:complete